MRIFNNLRLLRATVLMLSFAAILFIIFAHMLGIVTYMQESDAPPRPQKQFAPPSIGLHTLPPNPPYDPTKRWETLPEYPGNARKQIQTPQNTLTKPEGIDLDVTYISRTPMYHRYQVRYRKGVFPFLEPGTENDKRWPDPGENVTFIAHFMNKGTQASGSFTYKWFIDGSEIGSGVHESLQPRDEGTATIDWAWGHDVQNEQLLGRHTVEIVLDPDNQIVETYESNNSIKDATGAISLIIALTPQLYEALETPVDASWPFSAEDWLQKQISAMNQAFADSIYPSSPNGIVERVRLDRIIITSKPSQMDFSVDGGFFMSVDDRYGNVYYNTEADVSGALIHELSHQVGAIDLYMFNVPLEILHVKDRNNLQVQMEYQLSYLGLMSNAAIWPMFYSEYSALALNSSAGYRRGYYGDFLFDTPAQTYIRVLDNLGNPASNTTVRFFQRSYRPFMLGSKHGAIDNTPEITVETDENGIALLPNRSVDTPTDTRTGHMMNENPFGVIDVRGTNLNFLVEISKGSHQEFSWLDITKLNLASLRGESTLTLYSHLPIALAPEPPSSLSGRLERGRVHLQWQTSPSPNIRGYNVYRAALPRYEPIKIASEIHDLSYSDLGPEHQENRATSYAVTTVDNFGRESGFSNLFWALRVLNPASVIIDENRRVILDPQSNYALLLQSATGDYLDTLGSFDLHLENSEYLAVDADGRLIFSHPGDIYSSRHSIRITDSVGNLLMEFGDKGDQLGQFDNPTGVATWGETCKFGGPYEPDAHTLFLAHFNDSLDAVDGAKGNGNGTSFSAGRFGSGVFIADAAMLSYPTEDNFPTDEGSIEFWFKPEWPGNEAGVARFFNIAPADSVSNNLVEITGTYQDDFANEGNSLWLSMNADGQKSVSGWSPLWQRDQWYHIAVTWQKGDQAKLYMTPPKKA